MASGKRWCRHRPGRGLGACAAVLILCAAMSPARSDQNHRSLRDAIEAIAAAHAFALSGAERLEGEAEGVLPGRVPDQIAKLLAAYHFILVRDGDGQVTRLIIVGGRSRADRTTDANVVPTFRTGSEHHVEATIIGANGRTFTARFLVDTGASTVVLPRAAATRLGLESDQLRPVTIQTANGTVAGLSGTLASVRVGSSTAADVDATFFPDDRLAGKYLLGMSFLGRFVLTFDDGMNRLILAPRSDFAGAVRPSEAERRP